MYEDLIHRLRDEASKWCTNCSYRVDSFTCTSPREKYCDSCTQLQAADAIEKQNVIISGLNETIKMYENETPQWIPVTERLPEYGTTVLVYRYSDRSQSWRVTTSALLSYGDWTLSNVTHWMPLLAPPAVDTEEQP